VGANDDETILLLEQHNQTLLEQNAIVSEQINVKTQSIASLERELQALTQSSQA